MYQRPKTVDVSASGVVVIDEFGRFEYQWPAFQRSQETRRLFVVFVGPGQFLMIPKRAFKNVEELNAMKALLELIPKIRGGGFPVQPGLAPISAPSPLPNAIVTDESN